MPRYRPSSSSAATTAVLAAKRFIPEKRSPPSWFTSPSSSNTEMNARPCRLPVLKSFGSCAGVIFTAPVPKLMSTSSASQITGISRPLNGCRSVLPCTAAYRGSSGCTATAVSPSIVSGRVVATTISPSPEAYGYAKLQMEPNSTSPSWPGTDNVVEPSRST